MNKIGAVVSTINDEGPELGRVRCRLAKGSKCNNGMTVYRHGGTKVFYADVRYPSLNLANFATAAVRAIRPI